MASNQTPTGRLDTSYSRTQNLLIEMADLIGHKWHPVILHQLFALEECGFSELHTAIDDISNKMLSDSLTTLEDHDLIERVVVSEKPVRVRYSLTDRGRGLEPVLESMIDWGRENLPDERATPAGAPPAAATTGEAVSVSTTGGPTADSPPWGPDYE